MVSCPLSLWERELEALPLIAEEVPRSCTKVRKARGREAMKFGAGFALTAQADPIALRDMA
jgi:hypothetical protein